MAQNQLPTEKEAADACTFMAEQVFAPAFFEKLASHGISPRNTAEAAQLMELGVTLGTLEAEGQYKSAAQVSDETGNPFLAQLISQVQPVSRVTEDSVKQAAAQLAAHPDVARAAQLYGFVTRNA